MLDVILERDLIGNAQRTGGYLRQRLEHLREDCPIVGDVRGCGMLQAIELVIDKETRRPAPTEVYISNRLRLIGLKHGLVLYVWRSNGGRYGEWSMITPALSMTADEVDDAMERLQECLLSLANELTVEGLLR